MNNEVDPRPFVDNGGQVNPLHYWVNCAYEIDLNYSEYHYPVKPCAECEEEILACTLDFLCPTCRMENT